MTEAEQREITRLCARTAQLLLSQGAETTLVVTMATRLGRALGVDEVECAVTANAIVTTVIANDHCITTARRVPSHGVNMTIVSEVQHIVLAAEAGKLSIAAVHRCLDELPQTFYPPWLTASAVALSCACFARLAHADWQSCVVVFFAVLLAMVVRIMLTKKHFSHFITFIASSFTATLLAGFAVKIGINQSSQTMLAASVLMLVPGFPLINALSDMLKGYMNLGIARWTLATVLTLAASIGIIFALLVLGLDIRLTLSTT